MNQERWQKIEELFELALERKPEERDTFLREACGADADLKKEVESLLAHQQPTGRFIPTLIGEAARLMPRDISLADSNARFIPGTVLASRYRIIGLVGKGGMGEVYRADDLKLGQPVALKFLPEKFENDKASLERLLKEVRIARQISHPNICRVFDVGEVNAQHFISMEYIDGEDLATLLRRIGRLPSDKAIEIASQLCAGLAAAHDEGVLHRDLKPANVMIDGRGKARITDFGLAGLADDFQGHELRAGTPAYMAPEQLAGKEVTARSDIYALGLVLYEIFTGKKAYEATTLEELMRLRESTTPQSMSDYVKEVDPLVERVILRCLERDPKSRPASAMQVAAALPGGDPLAAAIAAGETPSPEMVAAAPKKGSLRPAVAVACFFIFLLEVIFNVIGYSEFSIQSRVPLEKPPDALADRASTIVKSLGYRDAPTDSAYGFDYDQAYIRQVQEQDSSPDRWDRLATDRPAAIYFWYRQSPRHLIPKGRTNSTVTDDDPPITQSGMVSVRLDTQGRLTRLLAVPPQIEESPAPPVATDWATLFSMADISAGDFKPVDPAWIPPVHSDERVAWEGAYPNQPRAPVRIEAASFRGKPVYFEIINSWNRQARAEAGGPSRFSQAFSAFYIAVYVIAVIASAALARRNLRQGRGDRKGAFRLAAFVFSAQMLIWAVTASHVPTLSEEMSLLVGAAADSLYGAAMVWLFYVALEPHVRRKWPDKLISWSRLLAGDFRDPMIGRDILIGGMAGTGIIILNSLSESVDRLIGQPYDVFVDLRPETLLGLRELAATLSFSTLGSAQLGLLLLFVFLLIYLIARKERLATGLAFLLLFAGTSLAFANSISDLIYFLLAAAVLMFTLARFGLFAFIMTHFFLLHSEFYPYTTDLSMWYADRMLFALLVALGLGLYGFYTSLAGQKVFRGSVLSD